MKKFLEPCEPTSLPWFERYFESLSDTELESICRTLEQGKHLWPVLCLHYDNDPHLSLDRKSLSQAGDVQQSILGTPYHSSDSRNCVLEILRSELGRRRTVNPLYITCAPSVSKRLTSRSRTRATRIRRGSTASRQKRKLRRMALFRSLRKSRA